MSQARAVTAMFVPSVASAFYRSLRAGCSTPAWTVGQQLARPCSVSASDGCSRLPAAAACRSTPPRFRQPHRGRGDRDRRFAGDRRPRPRHNHSALSVPVGRARANNAVIQLSANGDGTIAVTNATAGTVHVILDVNGYLK